MTVSIAPLRTSAAAAVLLVAGFLASTAAPAAAGTSAKGPEGQILTVSKTTGLPPAGETVTVEGSGYDENKGIYVAFCVDNGPGAVPTPCGGGADTTGSLGASHWISSNPPSYGEGLAVPYGDGGSFSVTLAIEPRINDIDCTQRVCAVVTRADHTRSADRSQDVRIPISFGGGGDPGGGDLGGGNGSGNAGGSAEQDRPPEAAEVTDPGTAPAATPAVTAAPLPTAAATPVADALVVSRVSDSGSAGRWWLGSTSALLVLLVALLIGGRRRRRAGVR